MRPNFWVSGAVLGLCVDRLAPGLWLVPQHDADMIMIARVLGSLKILFNDLKGYYTSCAINDGDKIQRFPFFQNFEFEGIEKTIYSTVMKLKCMCLMPQWRVWGKLS